VRLDNAPAGGFCEHVTPESRPNVLLRRRLRIVLWTAVAVPLALLMLGASLIFYTPGWYRSHAGGPIDPQVVRDDLRDAAQGFSDALMQPGSFDVHLGETQLNRWLAMRAEIYPLIDRRIPPDWRDLAIRFRDDVIRLGATYRGTGPAVVLSLDLAVTVESNAIRLKVVACRAGAMPIPIALLGRVLARPIEIPPGKAWRGSPEIRGDLKSGLLVGTRAVWPNGDRLYNVLAVAVRRTWLDFKIESLGPARQSRRSVQPEGSSNPFTDSP